MAKTILNLANIGKISLHRRKGLKNIRLSIDSRGQPRLSLPWYVPKSVGVAFVKSKQKWLKEQLSQHLPISQSEQISLRKATDEVVVPRLKLYAKNNNIKINNVKVKKLRSRWGSCDSHQNITVSLYIASLPGGLIDYVLYHELAHTKHMNHSKGFWKYLEKLMPDYKTHRKALAKYRPNLYNM